jgi:hypothetical protein
MRYNQNSPSGFWLNPDSDIVCQIVQEAKSTTHLQRISVKGHQDKKKKYSQLIQPERFKVDANASATKMRFEMTEPTATVVRFLQHNVNVYIQDQLISSSLDTRLMEMFTVDDYWRYYEQKYDWTKATQKLIEWDMYHTQPFGYAMSCDRSVEMVHISMYSDIAKIRISLYDWNQSRMTCELVRSRPVESRSNDVTAMQPPPLWYPSRSSDLIGDLCHVNCAFSVELKNIQKYFEFWSEVATIQQCQ